MRKRYSRSYTVLSFLTMFSYREQPFVKRFYIRRLTNNGTIDFNGYTITLANGTVLR